MDETVTKVVGESPLGSFAILPRHIDMSTALVPGILNYVTAAGREAFVALDGGILVKQGDQVSIATTMAVQGELGSLRAMVEKMLNVVDERERKTRSAVARLEADFIRRFVEFGKNV
jgi:F-type H+-transporting ATPase subunit epsilon